jgi:hypothetical protein
VVEVYIRALVKMKLIPFIYHKSLLDAPIQMQSSGGHLDAHQKWPFK